MWQEARAPAQVQRFKHCAIKTLFGCLKSRGFDLESIHMSAPDRMDKLMGILALAFTRCLVMGYW